MTKNEENKSDIKSISNKKELAHILSKCRQEYGYVELNEIIKILQEEFDDEEIFIIKRDL